MERRSPPSSPDPDSPPSTACSSGVESSPPDDRGAAPRLGKKPRSPSPQPRRRCSSASKKFLGHLFRRSSESGGASPPSPGSPRRRAMSVSPRIPKGASTPSQKLCRLANFFGVRPFADRPEVPVGRRRRPVLSSDCRRCSELDGACEQLSPIPGFREGFVDTFSSSSDSRIDYAALDDDKIIPTFMSSHVCYSAMPKSGKVIILSTDLLIKNAFSSLLVNEIRSAPLWDSTTHSFVGILTITDFINVLRHYYYTSKEDIHAIEDQQIQTWRRLTNVTKPFVKIGPCDSLADAAKALIQEGVHRLPVFDDKRNSVLFILSSRRLLQYLHQNLLDKFETSTVKTPSFMKKTVGELRIGTYEDIAMVSPDTKVIQALDIFVFRNISSLPVVENSRLTNIFAKFDVFALAKEQTYHNLNMSISEALDKAGVHEEICVVTMNESLEAVIRKFVTYKVHRVVVIDENNSVIGMISLSDILKYLIVQPLDSLGDSVAPNDTIEEEGALCGSMEQEPKGATEPELQSSSDVSKPESEDLSYELRELSIATRTGEDQANWCKEP